MVVFYVENNLRLNEFAFLFYLDFNNVKLRRE